MRSQKETSDYGNKTRENQEIGRGEIVQIIVALNGDERQVIAEWPLNEIHGYVANLSGGPVFQIIRKIPGKHAREIYIGPKRRSQIAGGEGSLKMVKLDPQTNGASYQMLIEMGGSVVIRGPRPLKTFSLSPKI